MLSEFTFKINVCCLTSNFISEQNPHCKKGVKTLLRWHIKFETSFLLMVSIILKLSSNFLMLVFGQEKAT